MPKTAIVTDTDSSLPENIASLYGIQQVPILIHFGEETFTCGENITDEDLFVRIDREGILPTTSAPPPEGFVRAYQKAFDSGADTIICVTVSGKISRTYESALTAVEEFPGRQITVIDSQMLSIAQGMMVLAGAQALAAGAKHDEAVQIIQSAGKRMHLFGSLTTLKYLAMGGRINKTSAIMGDLFVIRPLLTARDGKLELLEKVRTSKAAVLRLVELVMHELENKTLEQIAFVHVVNYEGAEILKQHIEKRIKLPDNILITEFTPGLSVHGGKGLVGVAFTTSET